MKKLIYTFIVSILLLINLQAQVKIGDNPGSLNENSILELENTDKGVLIPRVALDNVNTSAPLTATLSEGTLIYNDSGTEKHGFYYWDGNKWKLVGSDVGKVYGEAILASNYTPTTTSVFENIGLSITIPETGV